MMLRCDRAALDTDKGILFCDNGGPCGKRLRFGECPLMSQKENEKSFEIGQQGIRCPYIPKSHRLEMVEQRCMTIEKRLQALEGKANNEVATDISDELPELHVGTSVRPSTIYLQALEGKANNEVATDISDELPELHVGNYVEVVGQPFVTPGLPVGTIDRVSYQAPFGWFTLGGSEAWYPRRSLRKLSDEEIIAEIGWERKA